MLCGYLKKQGEKGLIKSFRQRWFVFDEKEGKLYYKYNNDNSEAIGFIDINSALQIRESNDNVSMFHIDVIGRVYNLLAKNEEERNLWVTGLRKHKDKLEVQKLQNHFESDDFEKQIAAIRHCGQLMTKTHNLELFGKLLAIAMKENNKDPAILREIIIALINSATLKKLISENEKDKTKELIKLMILHSVSKNLELQVTALSAIQILVMNNDLFVQLFVSQNGLGLLVSFLQSKGFNVAVQRKALQLLAFFSKDEKFVPQILKLFDKKTVPELLDIIDKIVDSSDGEIIHAVHLVALLSKIDDMKPLIGTRTHIKVLIDALNKHYNNPDMRIELGTVFINLVGKEKVREIVYEVGGQTIVNFINQVTKEGGTKYVLWHNKMVPANLAPPSSLSDQVALIKAAKDIPLKDKIIQMLNALLKQKKKELDIPVGLKISDITLPTEPTESITISPYFISPYELCIGFKVAPTQMGGKIVVSPSKGVKIGVTASQISAEGKMIIGFNPDTSMPAWLSFPDVPTFSFKIGVTNLAVPVDKLVKEFVKIAIKHHLLYPKRYFFEDTNAQSNKREAPPSSSSTPSSSHTPSPSPSPSPSSSSSSKYSAPHTTPTSKSRK